LSYTFTLQSGEYAASAGTVATTLCVCDEPGSVTKPEGGPPLGWSGLMLKLTKIGDKGTLPLGVVSAFSSKTKYLTTCPRYHPVVSAIVPPPSRDFAVDPSGTIGQLTIMFVAAVG